MNLYFNPNISKEVEQKIRHIFEFVDIKLSNYFNIENPDIYFANVKKENENVNLTATQYESGVVFFRLFKNQFNEEEILETAFHELNHIKYSELFSTEQNPTLFNWMLAEGLSVTFEKQAEKDLNRDWSNFYPKQDCSEKILRQGLREIIEIDENNKYWNHYDWFSNGDNQADYPQDFAYKIGDFLVSEYCKKFNILPHQTVEILPKNFLDFAKELVCEK